MAGTLFPEPWFTALDDNGNVLPGALLYFYAAGSSTPISTFSDITLLTPNSNPCVADSAGRIGPVYLTPGLSYKAVLYTAGNVLVRSQDNIPASPSTTSTPPFDNTAGDYRLTLTSGTPVTVVDVLAATTVYVEPFGGNRLALYDGSAWNLRTVVPLGIAVPNTASTCFDVFAWDNSTTIAYETLAWSSDTARATAITFQDGVPVKTGATTRRYLGTFRTTAVAGQTEDSRVKRYLWNYSRRVRRLMLRQEDQASWTYTTATLRQARATTANQLDLVLGLNEDVVVAQVIVNAANTNAGVGLQVAIGVDSTTTATAEQSSATIYTTAANYVVPVTATCFTHPGLGRHTLVWLEYSAATGTTTWYGTGAGPGAIIGHVMG